jgi:hypothetical protein
MYGYPVRLPPFSNREDFPLTVGIFDDDTGSAINLSGTTGSGTFSFWNVTAGVAITTSTTQITIPTFPIGNQLSALALTVGTNLTINAGDPITISDVTGNNKMQGYVTSYAPASGILVAQIGCTYQFEIRSGTQRPAGSGFDYTWWFDFGTISDIAPKLTAALGVGAQGSIFVVDNGIIQIRFAESVFKTLHLSTYMASLTMFDGADTRQIFISELPVQFGGVTN